VRGSLNVRIATGHSRDDQAETVMLRILRGSGLSGLAGIHPVAETQLIRPLLDISRAEIVEFCASVGSHGAKIRRIATRNRSEPYAS